MKVLLERFFGGRPELVSLRPIGGEIYAHLFENPRTGVARNLFWNLRIDCEPVRLDGEEWDCSVAVEWLRWTVPNWRSLDAKGLRDVSAPEMVEASVYLVAEHHTVAVEDLRLTLVEGNAFSVRLSGTAVIGGSPRARVEFDITTTLNFTGVVVVPGDLFPKPVTAEEVNQAVSQFIALDGLRSAEGENHRFLLAPR
jgi:hypothetical protein